MVKLKLYERDAKVVLEVVRRLATFHSERTDDERRHRKLQELGNWGMAVKDGVIGADVFNDLQTYNGKHAAVADYLSSVCNEIDTQLKTPA